MVFHFDCFLCCESLQNIHPFSSIYPESQIAQVFPDVLSSSTPDEIFNNSSDFWVYRGSLPRWYVFTSWMGYSDIPLLWLFLMLRRLK